MTKRLLLPVCLFIAAGAVDARADETSHRQAAEELLNVLHVERNLDQTIDRMVSFQVQQNANLRPYQQLIKDFYSKYMSYPVLKDDMIKLYMEAFSEDELKATTNFYRTPTGNKIVEKLPDLMVKGGEIGLNHVQAHLPELRQMISKESERLRGSNTAGGGETKPAIQPAETKKAPEKK